MVSCSWTRDHDMCRMVNRAKLHSQQVEEIVEGLKKADAGASDLPTPNVLDLSAPVLLSRCHSRLSPKSQRLFDFDIMSCASL